MSDKMKFNLRNPEDVEDVLNLIQNGNFSDIELSDDEDNGENSFGTINPGIRVGAEQILARDEARIEKEGFLGFDEEIESCEMANMEEEEDTLNNNNVGHPSIEYNIVPKVDMKYTRRFDCSSTDVSTFEFQISPINTDEDILYPITYFMKYFTEDIFLRFAENTNLYAIQQNNKFRPTNSTEIKKLFALHIATSYIKYPRIRMYWSHQYCVPMFYENMSRDRFFQLRTNLHIVNNLDRPKDCCDAMFKIRPLYDAIQKKCMSIPFEENLCIDEQMVPFTGKLSVKQYVKGKPCPWGIKIFLLCGKSGILHDFIIYQGKNTSLDEEHLKKYGVAASVVLHLSRNISDNGHKLFFDNFFNSFNLLKVLKNKNIYAAGTARINRFGKTNLLSDKEMLRKQRGSSDQVGTVDNTIFLTKWVDNRCVVMASNFIGIGNEDKVQRWDKKEKKYIKIDRPEVINLYNRSMGGVDLLDQLISLYRIFIRSRKWSLRMITHAIDMAIANSWLEYRRDCERLGIKEKKILDLLHFKIDIAESLANSGNERRKRGRPRNEEHEEEPPTQKARPEVRPKEDVRSDGLDHLPDIDKKKESSRCKIRGCTGKTRFYCIKCKCHLCITPERNCFIKFHN